MAHGSKHAKIVMVFAANANIHLPKMPFQNGRQYFTDGQIAYASSVDRRRSLGCSFWLPLEACVARAGRIRSKDW
jgi:hypothetical protein